MVHSFDILTSYLKHLSPLQGYFFATYPVTLRNVVTGKFHLSWSIYYLLHIMLNPVVCKYGANSAQSTKYS